MRHLHLLTLPLVALTAACGSSAPAPTSPAAPPTPTAAADPVPADEAIPMCVRLHEDGARCAPQFVDVIFATRGRHNPRFAAMLADPATRAEFQGAALAEIAAEGTGPAAARQAKCTEFVTHGPPTPRADADTLAGCAALTDCAAWAACIEPVLDAREAAGGFAPPEGRTGD